MAQEKIPSDDDLALAELLLKSFTAEELEAFGSEESADESKWQIDVGAIGKLVEKLDEQEPKPEVEDWISIHWISLLHTVREIERDLLCEKGVDEARQGNFIGMGWAFFDGKEGEMVWRFVPPTGRPDALEVVLITDGVEWFVSSYMKDAVVAHPTYRYFAGDGQESSTRARVTHRLQLIASLNGNEAGPYRAKEWAQQILHLLENWSAESNHWKQRAVSDESFWYLLARSIDFGRHDNARRLFRDGRLVGTYLHSVSKEKVKDPDWMRLLEEAMRDYLQTHGHLPSDSKLRKLLGSHDSPGSADVELTFDDPRFSRLRPIRWGVFRKYANRVRKSCTDYRVE